MSGNYVQRGEMAIMDKWARAKAALQSGADLVFELPFSTAVQAADLFSLGSINQLASNCAHNLLVFLYFKLLAISPQFFKVIKFTSFGGEDVYYYIS